MYRNLYWRLRGALYRNVPGGVRFYDADSLTQLLEGQGLTVNECDAGPGRVRVLARSTRVLSVKLAP